MKLYRLLTGSDDAAFCKKVSEALNQGWSLYGSPSVATNSDGSAICGQAVIKEAPGDWSDAMKDEAVRLSKL